MSTVCHLSSEPSSPSCALDLPSLSLQVEGKAGLPALAAKIRTHGPTAAFHGALASAAATALGHYPWFAVYNTLQEKIPKPDDMWQKLARNAGVLRVRRHMLASQVFAPLPNRRLQLLPITTIMHASPISTLTTLQASVSRRQ